MKEITLGTKIADFLNNYGKRKPLAVPEVLAREAAQDPFITYIKK